MQPQQCSVCPAHIEDVQWGDADNIFPWSDHGTDNSAAPFVGIVFESAAAAQQFEIEFILHYELAGSSFNALGTTSHAAKQDQLNLAMGAAASATYGVPGSLPFGSAVIGQIREMATGADGKVLTDFARAALNVYQGKSTMIEETGSFLMGAVA
jgi:hypothetical protein